MSEHSREYLEEVMAIARKELPGWVYAVIHQQARSRAGGRASNRTDEPSILEKIALAQMKPSALADLPDEEIRSAWLRLNQWFSSRKKQKKPIEDVVNAAVFVVGEMRRRKFRIGDTELAQEAAELQKKRDDDGLPGKLKKLPEDLVVIQNFVSVVGSAAKGKTNPSDFDVLIRAPWKRPQNEIMIDGQNVHLPLRNALDPDKEDKIHWIDNPQGAHGDHVPLYDLVLRRKQELKTVVVKEDLVRLDLGCGSKKPDGYIGIDKQKLDGVDYVHDLERGIPFPDEYADVIRASHCMEHLANKDQIMREIHRVLKPNGVFEFEIPSTKGEGAFAHPDHKSWWNKSSFAFWTQDGLTEDRPRFKVDRLDEEEDGSAVYVRGSLRKVIEKAIRPKQKFDPPKPTVAGFTELFDVSKLWEWAKDRLPIAVEPKHNGFRAIAAKRGSDTEIWFEGQMGKDQSGKFPELSDALSKIDRDFVLDGDIGILVGGKRLPRPDLQKFNSDDFKAGQDETVVFTAFDVPFMGEDLSGQPFEKRRPVLEDSLPESKHIELSPLRWVDSEQKLKAAARWAFNHDRSEGAVAKTARGKYEEGSTNEWSKLKRIAELKVKVLDLKPVSGGGWNYWGGLLPSGKYENQREVGGSKYTDLGKTLNTGVKASVGDVITVEVLELIPNDEKKNLSWLGARVIDVDTTRKEPYSDDQAIDIASRSKVLQKSTEIVPTSGGNAARVMFVGASPGKVEIARGQPLVGPAGETFRDLYLDPLGLTREDVALTNAVPVLLTDEQGRVREPTPEEAKEWEPWLSEEIERISPETIVALGRVAASSLGDRADFVLPHPSAVRRFGNSGEVARKLKQIQRAISKTEKRVERGEGGDETRGHASFQEWEKTWFDQLPKSGKGEFVYQHHWRGLNEDEAKLSDKELLDTPHSIHGDIRLTGEEGLWGWAVFLGEASANKEAGGDKLFAMKAGEEGDEGNIQLANKLPQPREWLTVGVKDPFIVEPGGPGSTSNKWSKFFAMDRGTYGLGVVRQHGVEIFLDGKHLKGRYLLQFAPVGGRRIWLIKKPADQKPMADTRDVADVTSDVKRKGQRFLVWSKPGEKPRRIDVRKEVEVKIQKADEVKRIVYGIVMDPYGEDGPSEDAHNDWPTPETVEESAHAYLTGSRKVKTQHEKASDSQVVESWVEQYPSQEDYKNAMQNLPHKVYRRKFGNDVIHSGSWGLGVKLTPEDWRDYKEGRINAFSPGGFGNRTPIDRGEFPKVEFVDLIPQR